MSVHTVPDFGPVSNAAVYGLEESIVRAKFPMATDVASLNSDMTRGILALAQSAKGSGHDNWLNGVVVQFDLTFTVKAWTEAERLPLPGLRLQPVHHAPHRSLRPGQPV